MAHHNSDIWAHSAPVGDYGDGDPVWAYWPMGGVWLAQHLWEHFAFGQNRTFLKEKAYPLMKGAAVFCLDWLYEDDQGYLQTAPSTSPEHKFVIDGKHYAVSRSATMDISLIWDLFTNCIEASEILGMDDDFRSKLADARGSFSRSKSANADSCRNGIRTLRMKTSIIGMCPICLASTPADS